MENQLTVEISNLFHSAHWYRLMVNIHLLYNEVFPKLSKAKMLCSIPSVKPCELSFPHHFWEERIEDLHAMRYAFSSVSV